jgi:hypothetical protein
VAAVLFAWLWPQGELSTHGLSWTAVLYLLGLATLGEVIEFVASDFSRTLTDAVIRRLATEVAPALA